MGLMGQNQSVDVMLGRVCHVEAVRDLVSVRTGRKEHSCRQQNLC